LPRQSPGRRSLDLHRAQLQRGQHQSQAVIGDGWGDNHFGQLGDGTITLVAPCRLPPDRMRPSRPPSLRLAPEGACVVALWPEEADLDTLTAALGSEEGSVVCRPGPVASMRPRTRALPSAAVVTRNERCIATSRARNSTSDGVRSEGAVPPFGSSGVVGFVSSGDLVASRRGGEDPWLCGTSFCRVSF
jgi:hypothetical protein